jgi:hypothetical protein
MAVRRSRKTGAAFEDMATAWRDGLAEIRAEDLSRTNPLTDRSNDMRTLPTTLLLLGLLGSVVTACGSATADRQVACDQAFAQAIAIDPASDTIRSVDGAIAGCQSLEAWVAAAKRYPDSFEGQDPAALASARCGSSPALANAPVCIDLQGNN